MKLIKRYSVAVTKLIGIFLEDGYYPMDPMEGRMIAKVLGFGGYHKLVSPDIDGCKAWKEIPKVKKTARLDLTQGEASAILDVYQEMQGNPNLDDLDFFIPTSKYLLKEFSW